MNLAELLIRRAQASPEAAAVFGPEGRATYGEVDLLAARAAGLLHELGVKAGDRVGLYAPKGIRTLAFMQGALRIGAAYVPVDGHSPPARAAAALAGCGAAAIVAPAASLTALDKTGILSRHTRTVSLDGKTNGTCAWPDLLAQPPRPTRRLQGEDALAYILYTSGSTGPMKGVCISHRNAFSFVRWAVDLIGATRADAFANHAPYNFDLSVFDIYGAFLSGGRLVTVPEQAAYWPHALLDLCRSEQVSVWYSVPTALSLMLQEPRFTSATLPLLRAIVFAGEVFPIKGVRALRRAFPSARLFNFYGPTETNVCTAFEVRDVPEDRVSPVPIGSASCGNRVWAETPDGRQARPGDEGELLVDGPTVAMGYWDRPFAPNAPYRTGDLVRVLADGSFEYIGRADRMVKLRGFRVEPGEVEAALASHPGVGEAAVIVRGEGQAARLVAFVAAAAAWRGRLTLLTLKQHCAALLPPYMTIGELQLVNSLPRTSNGKIDYLRLRAAYDEPASPAPRAAAAWEGT